MGMVGFSFFKTSIERRSKDWTKHESRKVSSSKVFTKRFTKVFTMITTDKAKNNGGFSLN